MILPQAYLGVGGGEPNWEDDCGPNQPLSPLVGEKEAIETEKLVAIRLNCVLKMKLRETLIAKGHAGGWCL